MTDLRERRSAFEVLFDGTAGDLPEALMLAWMASRALARDALDRACQLLDRRRATAEVVAALADFARHVEPPRSELSEWQALGNRLAIGMDDVAGRPRYVAAAMRRRLRYEIRYRRWLRTGVYASRAPLQRLAPARRAGALVEEADVVRAPRERSRKDSGPRAVDPAWTPSGTPMVTSSGVPKDA